MIETLEQSPADMAAMEQLAGLTSDQLIAHILERYHTVHLRDLPRAIELARNVERSASPHPHPAGLSQHLQDMLADLHMHQQREECILFPLLAGGARGGLQGPLARMAADHADVHVQLETLSRLMASYDAPPDASSSWRELCGICRKFDTELNTHMRIEDEILFPRGR